MKKTSLLPFLFTFVFVGACAESVTGNPAQLLFASGFEGDVHFGPRLIGDSYYEPIVGMDSETGYRWPIAILGASESALHIIDHDNYRALFNSIETVTGHDGTPTRALYNAQKYDIGVTQDTYEVLNVQQGRSDLYVRYWMKLDGASLHQPDMWRAIFEYKTRGYRDVDENSVGFRLIAFVYADEKGQPYWHWQGDADPGNALWEVDNFDIPVPEEKWFLTEYYWHWGEGKTGRALWRINGQVVADVTGPTTRNNQPIDFILLTQLYGDGNPKYQWIDDIEIWDGLPERYFPDE